MVDLSKNVSAENLKEISKSFRDTLTELLIPLIFILVVVVLIFFAIVPGIKAIEKERDAKAAREGDFKRYAEKNQQLRRLSSQKAKLDKTLSLAKTALPDEKDIPELMTQLQDLAIEASLDIANLQYGGKVEKGEGGEVGTVRLQMKVVGSYLEIEEMFQLSEEASRIVLIDQFTVGISPEASMSANLAVSSFFLPPPDEARIDIPISLDLLSPEFEASLKGLKSLKVYEVRVVDTDVGKTNPFAE